MKKYILTVLILTASLFANSQTIWNFWDGSSCISEYNKCWTASDDDFITEHALFYVKDTSLFHLESDTFRVASLSDFTSLSPSSFVWADQDGVLKVSPLDSLYIPEEPIDTIKTRSFNSSFIVNSDQRSFVSYSIEIISTLTSADGQAGTVFLEISSDDANWDEIGRISNSNTGTVDVGSSISQAITSQLSGYVPAGYYVRLRTSGNASIVYINGNETHF